MLGTVAMITGLLAFAGFLMWLVELDLKRSARKSRAASHADIAPANLEPTRPLARKLN